MLDVTDIVPSPVVPTLTVKPPNSLAGDGMLVMTGVVAVARPMLNVWALPVAAV